MFVYLYGLKESFLLREQVRTGLQSAVSDYSWYTNEDSGALVQLSTHHPPTHPHFLSHHSVLKHKS